MAVDYGFPAHSLPTFKKYLGSKLSKVKERTVVVHDGSVVVHYDAATERR